MRGTLLRIARAGLDKLRVTRAIVNKLSKLLPLIFASCGCGDRIDCNNETSPDGQRAHFEYQLTEALI
jgi:hypothetical protein